MTKVLSVADFKPLVPPEGRGWGSPLEKERRRRIVVSHAAYAYEFRQDPIMPDTEYDALAQQIDHHIPTGHPLLDEFFYTQFSPMTGMWIHNHPELDGIEKLYWRYKRIVRNRMCLT